MRNLRRIVQIGFFLLFVWLLIRTEYAGKNEIPYPVKIFFDFDPLISLANILAFKGIPSLFPPHKERCGKHKSSGKLPDPGGIRRCLLRGTPPYPD